MLYQRPSPPYWSHREKSHIFRIILRIYFLRETYFPLRYEENDIIFSVNPHKQFNPPNRYLTVTTYEVISKFVWSASILGWTHIIVCRIIYWCRQGVYVDNLGCLGFLFQLTTHSKGNLSVSQTADENNHGRKNTRQKSYSNKSTHTMVRKTP